MLEHEDGSGKQADLLSISLEWLSKLASFLGKRQIDVVFGVILFLLSPKMRVMRSTPDSQQHSSSVAKADYCSFGATKTIY